MYTYAFPCLCTYTTGESIRHLTAEYLLSRPDCVAPCRDREALLGWVGGWVGRYGGILPYCARSIPLYNWSLYCLTRACSHSSRSVFCLLKVYPGLAQSPIAEPHKVVSVCELELAAPGPRYTYSTWTQVTGWAERLQASSGRVLVRKVLSRVSKVNKQKKHKCLYRKITMLAATLQEKQVMSTYHSTFVCLGRKEAL